MSTETKTPEILAPAEMLRDYPMMHDQVMHIELDGPPLAKPRQTRREFGLRVPKLAEIHASDNTFTVLDTRETDLYIPPMLVVDSTFHYKDNPQNGYKGVWTDEPTTIGRAHHADRFDYSGHVSGTHFSIAYDGLRLAIRNHQPLNGTLLSGNVDRSLDRHADFSDEQDNIRDVFTEYAQRDVRDKSDYFESEDNKAPYGYYKNYMIIGRDTRTVKDGVYFTTQPPSEAVVVDYKSRALQFIAQDVLSAVEQKFGEQPTGPVESILEMVNEYTQQVMPYDRAGADRLSEPRYDNNGLINLSEYVKARAGVCRHQCLVAAFLMESLVDNKIINGQPAVERNHDVDAHGAHAWAMFHLPTGESIVVDPAQGFVGTKAEARTQKRWKYELSEAR